MDMNNTPATPVTQTKQAKKPRVFKQDAHSIAIEKVRAEYRMQKAQATIEALNDGVDLDFPTFWEWVLQNMGKA